jgi:hypothetical protein
MAFVRWQHKKRRRGPILGRGRLGEIRWSAVLVAGHRVRGRVRQEFIAFLGAIAEGEIRDPSIRRAFWERVTRKLDQLGHRVAPERGKIEAKLAEVVRQPKVHGALT